MFWKKYIQTLERRVLFEVLFYFSEDGNCVF